MSKKINEAMRFAIHVHAGQKYGDQPFWSHPHHAANIAKRYGLREAVQVAAWLHDVVEDTETTLAEVEAKFGPEVAFLVDAVTEPTGLTRRERHPAAWAKLKLAGHDAVAVKLSDRIANIEASLSAPEGCMNLFKMYAKEYPGFREALRDAGPAEMWIWLDHLMDGVGLTTLWF